MRAPAHMRLHTCTVHTCTCVHAYMHTCIHAYMHTCIHAYIHTYMHTCIHAYMHTCIHAYMHTCIHAHMHTCTHADVHTFVCFALRRVKDHQNLLHYSPLLKNTYVRQVVSSVRQVVPPDPRTTSHVHLPGSPTKKKKRHRVALDDRGVEAARRELLAASGPIRSVIQS